MLEGATHVLDWWLNNTGGFASEQPNTMGEPYLRGGGWGLSSSGQFELADDEALIVTIDPLDADYIGAEVWDPWSLSRDFKNHTSPDGHLKIPQ